MGPASTSQPSFRPQPPPPTRKPPTPIKKPNTETAIVLAGDMDNDTLSLENGGDPQTDQKSSKDGTSKASKARSEGQNTTALSDNAQPSATDDSDSSKPATANGLAKALTTSGQNAISGPKPPPGPAPPVPRPPHGPGFNNQMMGGMHPMDGPMNHMMGMSGPMMGMSGPMGPMPMFRPGFPPMGGPFPMGGPMMGPMGGPMGGPMMPHPMMMGGMPGPMMDPMGRPFMPDFGSGNFGDFGDR